MTGVSILVHPGIAHQFFLSIGLTSYVLNAPRQTVISANKEGLVSLTGKYYLTLFLPLDYDHAHSGMRLSCDTSTWRVDWNTYNTSFTFLFSPTAGCCEGTP